MSAEWANSSSSGNSALPRRMSTRHPGVELPPHISSPSTHTARLSSTEGTLTPRQQCARSLLTHAPLRPRRDSPVPAWFPHSIEPSRSQCGVLNPRQYTVGCVRSVNAQRLSPSHRPQHPRRIDLSGWPGARSPVLACPPHRAYPWSTRGSMAWPQEGWRNVCHHTFHEHLRNVDHHGHG